MNLEFVFEHFVPIVLVACLVIGYIIKKSLDIIPNKYIPMILAVAGAFISCVAGGGLTLDNVVYGAVTGLASTGMHQAFMRIIEGDTESE